MFGEIINMTNIQDIQLHLTITKLIKKYQPNQLLSSKLTYFLHFYQSVIHNAKWKESNKMGPSIHCFTHLFYMESRDLKYTHQSQYLSTPFQVRTVIAMYPQVGRACRVYKLVLKSAKLFEQSARLMLVIFIKRKCCF